MNNIVFECAVEGMPHPAPRPRVTKYGTYAKSIPYETYRNTIIVRAREAHGGRPPRLTGPLRVHVTFYGKVRGDIDNLCKGVLDGLVNAGVFEDDRPSIVRGLHADIINQAEPLTVIKVERLYPKGGSSDSGTATTTE